MLMENDLGVAARAMNAKLKMKKIDINGRERAAKSGVSSIV